MSTNMVAAHTGNMAAALTELNAVHAPAGRVYDIRCEGDKFFLVMPGGMGEYPPATKHGMMERLVTLRIAATGRAR